MKYEIWARGAKTSAWGVCKQEDRKDNVRMSVDLTICRCMNVKQMKQWIKLMEHEACEGSHCNGDYW